MVSDASQSFTDIRQEPTSIDISQGPFEIADLNRKSQATADNRSNISGSVIAGQKLSPIYKKSKQTNLVTVNDTAKFNNDMGDDSYVAYQDMV